jgi:hypothetical protein
VRGAACRLCDATAHGKTKGAAALAVSKLIDVYGSRLVLECVADYLRKYLGLDLWAARYEAARDELRLSLRGCDRLRVTGKTNRAPRGLAMTRSSKGN